MTAPESAGRPERTERTEGISAPLDVFAAPLDGCTLVEASAGTGKTWAICGLVLRLLLERRLPVEKILVVTFTKAATAELKERIRSRIQQTLQRLRAPAEPAAADPFVDHLLASQRTAGQDDTSMALLLNAALQDFDQAAIHTIHAWCQRALGDTPLAAGMPLQQTVGADDSLLQLQVAQDFWRQQVVHGSLPPRLLAELAQRGDSPQYLAEMLKRQQAKPLARLIWPAGVDEAAHHHAHESTLAAAFSAAQQAWATGRDDFLAAVQVAFASFHKGRIDQAKISQACTQWDALLAGTDPVAAALGAKDRLMLFTPEKLAPTAKKPPMAPDPFPALAQSLLDARETMQNAIDLQRLRLLKAWLAAGPAALQAAKRQARSLAYDDLLLNLYQRLDGACGNGLQLAQALRQRWPAALVDEFQDTDPLQYAIFRRIYMEGTEPSPLFFVGDPKQAIYSFRHADLRTYLRARELATRKATLQANQRSAAPLVQACNALFSQHPAAFLQPGLDFHAVAVGTRPRPLVALSGPPSAAMQLWALPSDPPLSKSEALHAAATATAQEIAGLLAQVPASDIAVLVRSHRQGALMRDALQACGVASIELSQASLWDSSDAEELAQVLAAVLAPTHAGTVRAALATSLMGLEAAALQSLADADGEQAAWVHQVQALASLRDLWATQGVGLMLRRLQAHVALPARLLARADGERRMTNWLHLAECLQQAATEHPAPERLLRWLQQQRSEPHTRDGEATQLRLESDRHLVQIVTIHRSKGLEYPFVYCPFLWDGAPGGSPGQRLEGREGFDEATSQATIDFRPLGDKDPELAAWKATLKRDKQAENLRLVYVALTRAVQRCTLVVGPYAKTTSRSPKPSFTEAAGSPLHWLVAGAGGGGAKADAARQAQVWRDFADTLQSQAPDAVHWQPLPADAGVVTFADTSEHMLLAALPGPNRLPRPWRMGSYSSLSQGARQESAAVDHDRRLLPVPSGEDAPAPAPAPASTPASALPPGEDDILSFPRGAAAGECLHAVFEHIDFSDATTWPAVVQMRLDEHAAALPGARPEAVLAMLADVLSTPLLAPPAKSLRLADVACNRRLNELEFTVPAPDLSAAALQSLLQQHGLQGPVLAFAPLRGYLRGFIDLVFEHQGRFHVLDWKSNHLGDTAAHYAPAALQAAMAAQGYHLQLLLYTLALHRWLQQRLPGYDYEMHMGEGLYMFVRGVRPGWQDEVGRPCGVHAWRPPRELIEALSALLGPIDDAPGLPSLLDDPRIASGL